MLVGNDTEKPGPLWMRIAILDVTVLNDLTNIYSEITGVDACRQGER